MIVYTDGSKITGADGRPYAGAGIWFDSNDARNSSIPILVDAPTNQIAELMAIRYALKFCMRIHLLVIRSDSEYSIKSLTHWYKIWTKNDWKTSSGKDVANLDLIKELLDMISVRNSMGFSTAFEHVHGHRGEEGNEGADKLASHASKMRMQQAIH